MTSQADRAVDLSDKLSMLARGMTDAERANYKLLLGMAAGGLITDGAPPQSGPAARAFVSTIRAIAELQPHRSFVPDDGIVYNGRPSFMTHGLLSALRIESASRRSMAERFDDHYVAPGGPVAQEVGFSTELSDLLSDGDQAITPTARTNYLYYDKTGLGIEPHVDNEAFSLNVILMLEHTPPISGKPSALVLYPPDAQPIRICLKSGELVIFYADSITHARERMSDGEKVRIVAFGFQAVSRTESPHD